MGDPMKTAMGTNVKIIVNESARPRVRAMFEVLGVRDHESPVESADVYVLGDGAHVGFFFVEASEALDEKELARSVWLEFRVEDVTAARDALDRLSIERVDYADPTHTYHRAPGGLVFRLAALR